MKIGQTVHGYTVFGVLPDSQHAGVFHFVGGNPGNKRPVFATFQANTTAHPGHLPEYERFEVFADSGVDAQTRRQDAVASLLFRSGCFQMADDHLKSFLVEYSGVSA